MSKASPSSTFTPSTSTGFLITAWSSRTLGCQCAEHATRRSVQDVQHLTLRAPILLVGHSPTLYTLVWVLSCAVRFFPCPSWHAVVAQALGRQVCQLIHLSLTPGGDRLRSRPSCRFTLHRRIPGTDFVWYALTPRAACLHHFGS